jgi:thioredoxin 1
VEKYAVYGLPTIMLFKNGEPVEGSKREGAINLPKLKDHLTAFGVEA